jgi:hypothetical protein
MSYNRSEQLMGKAHGAQKPECIFIHEDFERRAT